MKWALLFNGVVVKISAEPFEDEVFREAGNQVIDIEGQTVQLGWILQGNKIGPINIQALISSRITVYQKKAPQLLADLYAANTLAGLNTPDSDALVDAFGDVILRLREGLWPTAIYRLQQKQPTLIATQERITEWIQIIYGSLV